MFPQSIRQEFLILYLFNYLIYIFSPYYSVSITKAESRSVLFPCWCSLISDSALFNNVRSKQKPSKPASLFDVHTIWLYPHSSFSQGIRVVIFLVHWKLLILLSHSPVSIGYHCLLIPTCEWMIYSTPCPLHISIYLSAIVPPPLSHPASCRYKKLSHL